MYFKKTLRKTDSAGVIKKSLKYGRDLSPKGVYRIKSFYGIIVWGDVY